MLFFVALAAELKTLIAVKLSILKKARPMPTFERITQNPLVMGGRPCIRGLRVTVGMIVGQISAGRTIDALLEEYPYVAREDFYEALRYAAWRSEEREVNLAAA
jgi:uncharacterized protein (DUF433 family)